MKKLLIILAVIIFVALAVFVIFKIKRSTSQSSPQSVASSSANSKSMFGTMLAFNINDAVGKSDTLLKGWTEFKKDNSSYESLKSNLEKTIQDNSKLVKTTGFALDRELVPYFTWNVIEPQKGQFDWELTDIYVKGTTNAGVKISAVIQPFASWDQKNAQANSSCKALDFAYYDYKVGPPNDLSEYENFLTKTVERYKDNVAVWEIGNEYDGQCGGYQDNPQGYFDLLKITSETIKKADPKAKVTNGAASEMVGEGPGTVSTKNFWTKFFELSGSQYIDYFNFHYNTERSQDAKLDPATFQEALTFINGLMDKSGQGGGSKKPLYLTEFGIYSGTPTSQPVGQAPQGQIQSAPPAGVPQQGQPPAANQKNPSPKSASQNLPKESQESQAALYFKESILAFANGVNFIYIDLVGSDSSVIGSSTVFNTDGQPRLFLAALKTIDQKLVGFSKVEKIAEGQYKFTVSGKSIYALWGSGNIPSEISGKVKVTDTSGKSSNMDAKDIKISDQPVFVEIN